MKKLLIIPLIIFASGCVRYYQPTTALEDGVYYAADDPAYINNYGYTSVDFYPWHSIDYFYLGTYPYAGYGAYGRWIGYGYYPWVYHPFFYPGRWPTRYKCGYRFGCEHGSFPAGPGYGRDRYTVNDDTERQNRGGEEEDGNENPRDEGRIDDRDVSTYTSRRGVSGVNRFVSTAPSGTSGNRGMVVESRSSGKKGTTRALPDRSVTAPNVSISAIESPGTVSSGSTQTVEPKQAATSRYRGGGTNAGRSGRNTTSSRSTAARAPVRRSSRPSSSSIRTASKPRKDKNQR